MATLQFFRVLYDPYVIHGSASSNIAGFKQCSKGKLYTLLYFGILLHCIVQRLLQVMFPSVCSFIVLVFTLSLHVSAYMAIFTNTQGKTKITKENNTGRKYKSKTCRA
jgi:hypothetical protein